MALELTSVDDGDDEGVDVDTEYHDDDEGGGRGGDGRG